MSELAIGILVALPPPPTFEECLLSSRKAGDAGRYIEARDWCWRALELEQTSAEAYELLGLNYQAEGETKLAIEAFRKAIYLERDFVFAYYGLSNLSTFTANWHLHGSRGLTVEEMRNLLGSEVAAAPPRPPPVGV